MDDYRVVSGLMVAALVVLVARCLVGETSPISPDELSRFVDVFNLFALLYFHRAGRQAGIAPFFVELPAMVRAMADSPSASVDL